VGSALAFLCAQGTVAVAQATHAISLPAAMAFALGLNVYFGARMLALRFRGEHPQVDPLLVAVALSLAACGVAARLGVTLPADVGAGLTLLACAVLGLRSARETRDAMQSLARVRS